MTTMTMVNNYGGMATMYNPHKLFYKTKTEDIDYDVNKYRITKLQGGVIFEVDTKYIDVKAIGAGSYGVVCSAIDTRTNKKVAIKKIRDVFYDDKTALMTLRELKLLRHVRHPNIISLKDVMIPNSKTSFQDVYCVHELMDTDLHRIIYSNNNPLSEAHIKYFMFQLLNGLNYLHLAHIIHRDIKPANLLLNKNCDLKICDFGMARTDKGQGQPMTEHVVTRWYRAPELLLCGKPYGEYGPSIDVWSAGCILAELLGRKPIFRGENDLDQIMKIIGVIGTQRKDELGFVESERSLKFLKSLPYTQANNVLRLFPEASADAFDLLWKMLEFNPKKRITVAEALKHRYMADLYDPKVLGDAPSPCDLDMDGNIGKDKIRRLIWSEMKLYRHGLA